MNIAKIKKIIKKTEKYTKTDMLYVTKGSFWLVLNKIGLLIASFVTMFAFGNWLDQESFGIYQYILSGTMIAGIFTLSGINSSIIKSISRNKDKTLLEAAKQKFRWSILGSLGLLFVSIWYFVNGNNILSIGFLIASILMPGEKIFTVFQSFWNGKKNFKKYTQYTLSAVFLSLIFFVPVIYLTNNVLIIILIYFLSHAFFEGLFYFKTKKNIENNEIDTEAIKFGKNLTAMNVIETIASHIDKVIVWQFLGPIQVAIYSFAILPINKIRGVLPISALALPKLGEKKIDKKRKKGVMDKFLKLFIIFIPMAIVLALIAPFIYEIFFPQYMNSIAYFQLLTILVAIGGPLVLLDSALVAEIKIKSLYITKITSPVIKIILFLSLIPFYGIWGMVWAIIISEIIRGIFLVYYFKKL